MNDTNKNEKQVYFNQLKGYLQQLEKGELYCNITLTIGHENPRNVNFSMKKHIFEEVEKNFKLGDKINIKFFLVSNKKNGRWYTSANVLFVEKSL